MTAPLRLPRRRAQPEYKLHCAVADYLNTVLLPEVFWTTFPAGGGGKTRGARLKRMGLVPGVADIMICWDRDNGGEIEYTLSLWIELKATTGQSLAQDHFQRHIQNLMSHTYRIARSLGDIENILIQQQVPCRLTGKRPSPRRAGRG